MRAAALLLLLPACDRVFGLDRDSPAIDAAIDVAPEMVTGHFTIRYVTNDASGAPIEIEGPHPDVTLSVAFNYNDEPTGLALDASGGFSFARPTGAPYRLIWQSAFDGNIATEWQTSAANLEIASLSAGRPTRVPVTLPTPLTFTTPTAGGTHVVLSTGLWTESGIPGDMLDWKQAYAASPPLGLLDAAANDRLFYVVRSVFPDPATGLVYTAFAAEATKPVTIADGMPQAISLAFATSSRDQCTRIVASRAAAMQRVANAAGAGTVPNGDDWIIQAAPGASIGPVGALTLAFHNEVAPTVATNQTVNVQYRNPFPGHHPIATMGAYYGRNISAPGALPLFLPSGVRVYVPVEPCPGKTALDTTQGIPGTISLEGVQLTGPDGTVLSLEANRPLMLSWSLAAPGPVHMSGATIYEVAEKDGETAIVPVRSYKTTGQSVMIGPGVIQPQLQYVVRLDANVGLVNAATGDSRTVQYPYGNATQWSHVFGISNP